MNSRAVTLLLHVLCAASGAAGLGLQLTWTRRFALGLGHELPSLLAVVTAFFLGLALGAACLNRRLQWSVAPTRWAAGLEFAIGLWALLTIPLLPWLNDLARSAIGIDPEPARQWFVCFAFPLLGLLPATVAMGATLAALERVLSTRVGTGSWIAGLYATNTAGAVVGVLITVGWLHPSLGFRATTAVWAGFHLACGVVLLWGVKASVPTEEVVLELPSESRANFRGPIVANSSDDPMSPKALAFALGLSGLVSLGFEVFVIRLLNLVLEGTVFTYSTILIVWLIGTATGAAASRIRRLPTNAVLATLPAALMAAGLCLAKSPRGFEYLRRVWGDSGWAVAGAEFTVVAVILLPSTLLMGALFSRWVQQAVDSGMGTGAAVAWNTLGAALAPGVVGVALFPILGGKGTLTVLAAGYGLLLIQHFRWFAPALLAAGVLFIALPAPLRLLQLPPRSRLLEFRQGALDSVAVYTQLGSNVTLAVNNRFVMGGTASTNAAERHSHLPLLLHPNPQRALFLGLGTGISYAAMGAYPGLTADGVELVPDVLSVQPRFAPYNDHGTNLQVHAADARRFARTTPGPYDVIVADLFHPARDGAGSLYTVEHYAALRALLHGSDSGLVCQWLPLYQLDEPTLRSITRSFLEVFPESHAFLLRPNTDTPVLGLVGWLKPPQFDSAWWNRRTSDAHLLARLKRVGLSDSYQLFGLWLAGPAELRVYAAEVPLNTDDHPYVTYAAPRAAWRRGNSPDVLLMRLLKRFGTGGATFPGAPGTPEAQPWLDRLTDFRVARDLYLQGLVAEAAGRTVDAERLYLAGAQRSVDFTAGYSRLITRAMSLAQEQPDEARRLLTALAEARPERPLAGDLLKRLDAP